MVLPSAILVKVRAFPCCSVSQSLIDVLKFAANHLSVRTSNISRRKLNRSVLLYNLLHCPPRGSLRFLPAVPTVALLETVSSTGALRYRIWLIPVPRSWTLQLSTALRGDTGHLVEVDMAEHDGAALSNGHFSGGKGCEGPLYYVDNKEGSRTICCSTKGPDDKSVYLRVKAGKYEYILICTKLTISTVSVDSRLSYRPATASQMH